MSIDSEDFINNTNDLRKMLTEQLILLKEGRTTPQQTNAVCNLTSKMIQTVRLDMDVFRFKNKGRIQPYSFEPPQIEDNKEDKKEDETN